jgi:hypothetical protein
MGYAGLTAAANKYRHQGMRNGVDMKKLSAALLGLVIISSGVSTFDTPASALGGCGPNRHRDRWGHCVFGGQNQDYCLRKTGHTAAHMPNGTMRCL